MHYNGGILELYRDNGKENGNYYSIMRYNLHYGVMENKMETTIIYWGYIGVYIGVILGI